MKKLLILTFFSGMCLASKANTPDTCISVFARLDSSVNYLRSLPAGERPIDPESYLTTGDARHMAAVVGLEVDNIDLLVNPKALPPEMLETFPEWLSSRIRDWETEKGNIQNLTQNKLQEHQSAQSENQAEAQQSSRLQRAASGLRSAVDSAGSVLSRTQEAASAVKEAAKPVVEGAVSRGTSALSQGASSLREKFGSSQANQAQTMTGGEAVRNYWSNLYREQEQETGTVRSRVQGAVSQAKSAAEGAGSALSKGKSAVIQGAKSATEGAGSSLSRGASAAKSSAVKGAASLRERFGRSQTEDSESAKEETQTETQAETAQTETQKSEEAQAQQSSRLQRAASGVKSMTEGASSMVSRGASALSQGASSLRDKVRRSKTEDSESAKEVDFRAMLENTPIERLGLYVGGIRALKAADIHNVLQLIEYQSGNDARDFTGIPGIAEKLDENIRERLEYYVNSKALDEAGNVREEFKGFEGLLSLSRFHAGDIQKTTETQFETQTETVQKETQSEVQVKTEETQAETQSETVQTETQAKSEDHIREEYENNISENVDPSYRETAEQTEVNEDGLYQGTQAPSKLQRIASGVKSKAEGAGSMVSRGTSALSQGASSLRERVSPSLTEDTLKALASHEIKEHLELDEQIVANLKARGIFSVAQLVLRSRVEILRVPGIGWKEARAIQKELTNHGIDMRLRSLGFGMRPPQALVDLELAKEVAEVETVPETAQKETQSEAQVKTEETQSETVQTEAQAKPEDHIREEYENNISENVDPSYRETAEQTEVNEDGLYQSTQAPSKLQRIASGVKSMTEGAGSMVSRGASAVSQGASSLREKVRGSKKKVESTEETQPEVSPETEAELWSIVSKELSSPQLSYASDVVETLKNVSLEDLGLSNKTIEALRGRGINTASHLFIIGLEEGGYDHFATLVSVKNSNEGLRTDTFSDIETDTSDVGETIPNVSETMSLEIIAHLRQYIFRDQYGSIGYAQKVGAIRRDDRSHLIYPLPGISPEEGAAPRSAQSSAVDHTEREAKFKADLENTPIDQIGLYDGAVRALKAYGIHKVSQLIEYKTENEVGNFIAIPGIAEKLDENIRQKLEDYVNSKMAFFD